MRLRQPGSFDKNVRTVSSGEVDCAGKPALPFPERVERVKELLADADSSYQSGRYDLAMKRYDQVLCLDPYNTAARRGQEKTNNTRYQYGEEAYNETRSRQMWQVEGAWQHPVRRAVPLARLRVVPRQVLPALPLQSRPAMPVLEASPLSHPLRAREGRASL